MFSVNITGLMLINLVFLALGNNFFILFAAHEVQWSELFKVSVLLPELRVVTLNLEASHLVEDGHVSSRLFGLELLSYLCEEFALVMRQVVSFQVFVEHIDCFIWASLLYTWLK